MTKLHIDSLAEQMGFDEAELAERKALIGFTRADVEELLVFREAAEEISEGVVEEFYVYQLQIPQVRRIIGDSETLGRLTGAMKDYVARLFCGNYGLDYVNSRLRIGRTHARIGVAPKFYVSSFSTLKLLIDEHLMMSGLITQPPASLRKLFLLDLQLVFDTYIKELLDEVELARGTARNAMASARMSRRAARLGDEDIDDARLSARSAHVVEDDLPQPAYYGPFRPEDGAYAGSRPHLTPRIIPGPTLPADPPVGAQGMPLPSATPSRQPARMPEAEDDAILSRAMERARDGGDPG